MTSFVFTELANTMEYGEGYYITLFSPSDVTAIRRIERFSTRRAFPDRLDSMFGLCADLEPISVIVCFVTHITFQHSIRYPMPSLMPVKDDL